MYVLHYEIESVNGVLHRENMLSAHNKADIA